MKLFILLDRSGSMDARWLETQVALREFMKNIDAKSKVWLMAFDTEFDLPIEGVEAGDWSGIPDEISPRGMTALYDGIARLARVVNENAKKKAQVVVITDGWENSSRETSQQGAKAIVEGWRSKGYDVVYLGADFDAVSVGENIGMATMDTVNYSSKNAGLMGATLAHKHTAYASGNARGFTDAEREEVK